MAAIPGGKKLFTKGVCLKAPYFSTISPTVEELKKGYCRVEMQKRNALHNHIKTVHAIAMCNLAELTMGMIAEASIPKHLRWLPKGMEVQYLAKAETDLYAISQLDDDCWNSAPDVPVIVKIFNNKDTEVMRATIKLWVTEKNSSEC